ncbi:hypothetical protein BG015_007504 [Linnemannia schmuckeri]|uniref:Uncharacterized protein n=1 Tax=Linnemannia schmuckeri TaxID=64567 RepID=A0A9P5VB95_9FUNG|nr:hypothetical protein BG015_007504 [Linnemannia schmuckeri]
MFAWVLYATVTFLLLSRGILTKYLDVDADGVRSKTEATSEQRLLNQEVVSLTAFKEEEELEPEREQTEYMEQKSCEKNVDTEDLSGAGQDIDRAQQILSKTPSLQVKNEIQIWSFSLWVFAPAIPRSFNQYYHRSQQQPQQQNRTYSNNSKDIRRQAPRHPQKYGPIDMKDGDLLLTASSSVLRKDMDESEYDLVLSEEASEFDRDLVSSVVAVATKVEKEERRRRSQDGRDGGHQHPIQDDGKMGSRSVLLQTEDQPSFGQMQRHRPPTRMGSMSQSMPDLHAVKRAMGPNPVETTLARWSRVTLDPERLGSIFQYYLRQRASTLKKDRQTDGYHNDDAQNPITSDDSQDDTNSNNEDQNDEVDPGVTFVIRSSTLPMVRVGLYGADQKRFWTSSGSIHLSPLPESDK